MKKILFLPLLTLLFLLPLSALAAGETYTCGDFLYVLLEDGSAALLRYTGSAAEVVIPAELDGHPVTAVQGNPFCAMYDFAYHVMDCTVAVEEGHPYLEVIDGVLFGRTDHRLIWYPRVLGGETYTVPEGTEIIGRHAFFACASLRSVTLPESLILIENHGFYGCRGLTEIVLPQTLTAIGDCGFMGCRELEALILPPRLEAIGWHCFDACPALVLTVRPGSPAEIFCAEYGLPFIRSEFP